MFTGNTCYIYSNANVHLFSFGIILWELLTREDPYESIRTNEVIKKVLNGYTLPIPDSCPKEYGLLIRSCTNIKPDRRPTFVEILYILQSLKI